MRIFRRVILCVVVLGLGVGCGGDTTSKKANDGASRSLDAAHGTEMIEGYLEDQVRTIESAWAERVGDREQWASRRPERVRRLREMLGLRPWPERSALQVTVTDTVEGSGYHVETLHFQSSPGLYVTANLYVPDAVREPRPAVLYLPGHATEEGPNGRPLGAKTAYQRHPAWYARHGYVALIIDTIQLGEIDGVHHGTYRRGGPASRRGGLGVGLAPPDVREHLDEGDCPDPTER